MRFNLTMFKEEFDENGCLKDKDRKVIEVQAETCCDAVVMATKANRGWTVSKWECLDKTKAQEFVPETKYEKEAWAKVLKWREEEKAKKEQEAKQEALDDAKVLEEEV